MEIGLHINLNIIHNNFINTYFHKHANKITYNLKYNKQIISSLSKSSFAQSTIDENLTKEIST